MPLTATHTSSALDGLQMGLLALVGGAVLYLLGWRGIRRRWAILNLPTSRVRSVAMGMAELIGTARKHETLLSSPVRQLSCVWYRVLVTRTTGSGRNRRTSTVFTQTVGVPFQLEDATGRILVVPDGAEVTATEVCDVQVIWGTTDRELRMFLADVGVTAGEGHRVQEWTVMSDAEVYVLGDVGKVRDAAAQRRRRVAEILQGWLKAPDRRAAIDADHDGRIDQQEWDAARGVAQTEALREETGQPAGPSLAVRRPGSGYFLIAAGGEKAALAAQGYPVLLVSGGILLVGLGIGLLVRIGTAPASTWGAAALFSAIGGWGIVKHLRS